MKRIYRKRKYNIKIRIIRIKKQNKNNRIKRKRK